MSIKPINLKRKKDGGRNSEAAGIDAPLANPHIYGKKNQMAPFWIAGITNQ